MALRNIYKVVCACGHEGAIKLSENDQPFSDFWQKYELINLDGGGSLNVDNSDWHEAFQILKIKCPNCGSKLSPDNIKF